MTRESEYTTFLDLVNHLSERRQTVTATYLSVNAALIGALAFLLQDGALPDWQQRTAVLVLFGAGIVACDLWRRIIKQYNVLLGWWYEQLHSLEEALPDSSRLIKREYEQLYARKVGRRPLGLSRYERRLTWVFTAAYVLFALVIVVGWVSG